jgi:hypothetical protein
MLTPEQKAAAALLKEIKAKEIECPYFQKGGSLYLSCRDKNGDYYFVQWVDGKPVFQQSVDEKIPRKVPLRDGVPVDIIGIPEKEAIEAAPLLSATDLYRKIEGHVIRYLDALPLDRELFIYYLLFTWFTPKVNTTPYLRFIADTGNGKSRMQCVIGDLCFYPIKAGGASTPAGIMRLKEKWNGTLLIDEADLRESTATNELIKYLNLGFERWQYFIKSDKNDPKQQDIFDPFGPKVIAMRRPFQDNATEGRLLSFSPKETTRTDIPFILPASYEQEVRELRAAIAIFVLNQWEKVDGENMINIRDLPIEPRLKQLALPLSIILQIFPDGAGRFRDYLIGRQQELKRIRASSLEGMVFNCVLEWVQDQRDTKGHLAASDIKDECGQKTPNSVTRILHSIGFKTDVIKEGKTRRVLVVPDERTWTNIIQRYYFTDDAKNRVPTCPEQLRSKDWVTQVTQVTLSKDEPKLKNNSTVTEGTTLP